MKLNDRRRARLIVCKVLEYAEAGGMEAQDCGATYNALDACLVDEEGLLDQVRKILDAQEWVQPTLPGENR